MKTYARVEAGVVLEIILPAVHSEDDQFEPPSYKAGDEIPIEQRYSKEFVGSLVDITDVVPMPSWNWTYDGSMFHPYQPPQPSPEEILQANTQTRDALLAIATLAIAPLQDAVDLDDATPADVALLKKWKQYRVSVNRADLAALAPAWPEPPV